jgi:hypothetical protein
MGEAMVFLLYLGRMADAAAISQDAKIGMQIKGYSAPGMLSAEEKAAFSEMKMQGRLSDDEIGQMTGALAMD